MERHATLSELTRLRIDAAALRRHVMRPRHVTGIISDHELPAARRPRKHEFTFRLGALYRFDAERFGASLHDALEDNVAGYSVRLQQGNALIYSRDWSWAKAPADGSQAWSGSVRMHVASCSKLITAIAMTRILTERKIPTGTPIIGFLPTYWVKGPHVDRITFRHLLTHTSGFDNGGSSASDFEFMKDRVARGVTAVGGFHYENMNFGLCRILLATILGDVPAGAYFTPPIVPVANDIVWDYLTIQSYRQYVADYVFAPAGVSGPTLDHPAGDALAYAVPVGAGWSSGDLTSMSGGAGWHMSPDDLLRVMRAFRRKGVITSAARAQVMLDNEFGIDGTDSTPIGPVYRKKGYWASSTTQVEQSLVYFMPRSMELVVLVNSPVGSKGAVVESLVNDALMASMLLDASRLRVR
jgi:CubicO group peptidase (beta-lactamase class C family)